MSRLCAAITGVQGYVPNDVLTNDDLSRMVDTSDEWITARTGIKERRLLKGEGLGTSHMGAEAVQRLLKKTGTRPDEIDVLVCATVTPDFMFPSTANLISHMSGLRAIGSFDVIAACSGFIYALNVGAQFVETGRARKAVVVGADKMSSLMDFTDRTTCVLFGDGAGAVLLEPRDDGKGLQDIVLHADGAGFPYIHQKVSNTRNPSREMGAPGAQAIHLDGPAVFRHAVERMSDVGNELLQRNGLKVTDIDWLVPHQANKRILEAVAARMRLPRDRLLLTVHKYGNTTAATIPLTLWEHEKRLKVGDRMMLAAFGGGYTWAGAYLLWAYDGEAAAASESEAALVETI